MKVNPMGRKFHFSSLISGWLIYTILHEETPLPYDAEVAKVLMTLSTLAYLGEKSLPNESRDHQQERIGNLIAEELSNTAYSTQGNWMLVWGPGLTIGNMMFIAQQTGTETYALVIRGTDWSSSWTGWKISIF